MEYYRGRARSPYLNGALVILAAVVAVGWEVLWFAPPWWTR